MRRRELLKTPIKAAVGLGRTVINFDKPGEGGERTVENVRRVGRRALLKTLGTVGGAWYLAGNMGPKLRGLLSGKRRTATPERAVRMPTNIDGVMDFAEQQYEYQHPHKNLIREITKGIVAKYVPSDLLTPEENAAMIRRIHRQVWFGIRPTGSTPGETAANETKLLGYKDRSGKERKMIAGYEGLMGEPASEVRLGKGMYAMKEYESHFQKIAAEVGRKESIAIPPWLPQVFLLETYFDTNAISRAGATGPGQFMYATGLDYGIGPAGRGEWKTDDAGTDARYKRIFRHVEDDQPAKNDIYAGGNGNPIDTRRDPLLAMRAALTKLAQAATKYGKWDFPGLGAEQRGMAPWILALLEYNGGEGFMKSEDGGNPYKYMGRKSMRYYELGDGIRRAGKDGDKAKMAELRAALDNDVRATENSEYPLRLFAIMELVKRMERERETSGGKLTEKDAARHPEWDYMKGATPEFIANPTLRFEQIPLHYAKGVPPIPLGSVIRHLIGIGMAKDEESVRKIIAKLNPAITIPVDYVDGQGVRHFDQVRLPDSKGKFIMPINLPTGWGQHIYSLKTPSGMPVFVKPKHQ